MRKKEEEEEEEKRGRDGEKKKDKRRCWPAKRGSKNESRRIRTHGTLTIIYSLRMRRYLLVHYIYIYSYSYVYCILYILYLSYMDTSIHPYIYILQSIHLHTLSRLQVIPLWAGAAPNRGPAPNRPTLGTAEGSLFWFVLIGPPLLCQDRASPPPSLPG